MRRRWLRLASFCLALFLAPLPGCDLNPLNEPPVRVLGRVTWHGQAITRGSIVFVADPERNDHRDLAVGVLHFDGSYELTTMDGEPPRPGWYRVTLVSDDLATPLPANYADPALSGLSATVTGPGPLRLDWALP